MQLFAFDVNFPTQPELPTWVLTLAILAGVPIAATSAASSVMIQSKLQEFGIILAIWICVPVISIASVGCGTALMISSRGWASRGNKADNNPVG
jgi:hypothetical protein